MSEEKKLHIDEDWKSQVNREKEQLRRQQEGGTSNEIASQESSAKPEIPAEPKSSLESESSATKMLPEMMRENHDLPPASLTILISSLASQAMVSLGQIPGDDGKPMPVNLPFARHFIDLIGVIEDKTRSNLTKDEAALLNNTLHHLRLLFVECSR